MNSAVPDNVLDKDVLKLLAIWMVATVVFEVEVTTYSGEAPRYHRRSIFTYSNSSAIVQIGRALVIVIWSWKYGMSENTPFAAT
jgi:hypothetical protein